MDIHPEVPEERRLLDQIVKEGRLNLVTKMVAGIRTLTGHAYYTTEWRGVRDPRISGQLDPMNLPKHSKLRDASLVDKFHEMLPNPFLHMEAHKFTELCTIGQVTEPQYKPEEHEDPFMKEEVRIDAKGLRGFLEKRGVMPRKKIMRPKRMIFQKHVGEKPLMLGEVCDHGGAAPAYALYYINIVVNPCDSDKRPRDDEAEIILPQELAEEALQAVKSNPALIRSIVARMITTVLDVPETRWLHQRDNSHGAFGIAYDEWKRKGRLYVHGPDAQEGYFEEHVREIP